MLKSIIPRTMSRDSSIGIETRYGQDEGGFGVRVPVLSIIIFSPLRLYPAPHPVGNGGIFPGGKADHSPETSVGAKKTWIYTSTPPIHLRGIMPA
jgi:hypothetical protein